MATSKLVTADAATKLQLTPLPMPVSGDVFLYEITVRDKAGVTVIDAKTPITINVEGGGKLIGLDNGDLEYIGLYKTNARNAYQGRILITVQKTAPANEIHITATAPGLATATIQTK